MKRATKVAAEAVTDNIDTIQMAIDVAGLIPVVGEAFDAANAAIYTARGDYVSAGLSLAACIPVAGSAATAAKLAKNTVKAVDKAQALSKVTKAVEKGLDKGITVIGPKPAYREFAEKIGANYLKISDEAWTWRTNRHFLHGVVKRGDDVVFAGKFDPKRLAADPDSVLAREVDYLQKHGYTWAHDYSRLVKVR